VNIHFSITPDVESKTETRSVHAIAPEGLYPLPQAVALSWRYHPERMECCNYGANMFKKRKEEEEEETRFLKWNKQPSSQRNRS